MTRRERYNTTETIKDILKTESGETVMIRHEDGRQFDEPFNVRSYELKIDVHDSNISTRKFMANLCNKNK